MSPTRADGTGSVLSDATRSRAATPEARVLAWLSGQAEAEGFVALSARRLAADLGLRTVTVRGILTTLADEGLLHHLGQELYSLTPAPAKATDDELRTDPHPPTHDGSGGTALW